ncbi:SusD/RagB family nutrient-binding outer membrane lipoprotein [Anaerorudis cellulosivorans]|uniref:SusD/RagB family nutrient-binding outer membrane lipoprotein n=1 Tax=Anaerorudis cellulosivorans TaxID=3397862 RepID=UPI00221F1EBB|nr:SusD/RagB family nutrient-binding outer membrane lipoprotein [Seramator thermalis]MCW1735325.1 SusD/RagB family nutrient-binding outer membrane lipoprotein [Seramator thermalis]
MKKIKYLLTIILSCLLVVGTSCRDDMADINTNPSQVVKGNIPYLFAQAVIEFEPSGYLYWFYNAAMTYRWGQMGVPTGGFTSTYTETTATGDQGYQYIRVLNYARDIQHLRSTMSEEESAKYASLSACVDILTVYLGIFDSDMYGDRPFTEASMARYGGTLTPKYDKIEDLYTLWVGMLDNAITTLTTAENQIFPHTQDVIYNGDVSKWAKLANSLKLKIAVRLLSQKKEQALTIASDVAAASCGVLDGRDDDFLFNKANAIAKDDGDKVYHWNQTFLTGMASSQRVVNFMLRNKDPRVRFFYRKNEWNSKIVQGFFDADKNIPAYILENVNYSVVDGKKKFESWKGLGEPWVRYYGLPVEMDAGNNVAYADYFDYANRCRLTNERAAYMPFSQFQQEMIIGRYDFTLPTLPGDPIIQDTEDVPWYGMYMSTAEVNLYLAEFKLLGANLPKTAEEYFNKGVRASVEEYDRLASLNKIPYYGKTYDYDPNEKVIDLKAGEIEAMLTNTDYQLTGNTTSDLEKVYVQQLIHFTLFPDDQFVTVRRSGCPKEESNLIRWENFSPLVPNNAIPRRFEVPAPSPTDKMYQILLDSYRSQGFTPGSNQPGTLLNSERVWQDKGAPQFGEGPKQ